MPNATREATCRNQSNTTTKGVSVGPKLHLPGVLKRKALLIWGHRLSAVSGDRSLVVMNWCSLKWMATTFGCFAGGTTLFVVGAYFSYVNIEPQRARTLARDQLLKDYLRKKYGYGITSSPPLQVRPVAGFPLISTLSPATSPSTPPPSGTTPPVPSG